MHPRIEVLQTSALLLGYHAELPLVYLNLLIQARLRGMIDGMLERRTRYLQVAFNRTLPDAIHVIRQLPKSPRIILEAGTPLIKAEGMNAVRTIKAIGALHFGFAPYVVADMKTMDRGSAEVDLAANAGANAIVALGSAPVETLDHFLTQCEKRGIDSMIDMMNVEFPIEVLGKLRKKPKVVILHRGVDETSFNKEKAIPYWSIQRIKGTYNLMLAIAGGDDLREVQRAAFNGADIVVVWQSFYQANANTANLAQSFLQNVK